MVSEVIGQGLHGLPHADSLLCCDLDLCWLPPAALHVLDCTAGTLFRGEDGRSVVGTARYVSQHR